MLQEIAQEYQFRILAMEVMPDHIHLLLDCKPQFFISDMIKIMKGNLARQLFLAHPELKRELWGGHLWNPSYCAVTVSDRSREQIMAYIEGQKEKRTESRGNLCRSYPAMARKIKNKNIPIRHTLALYREAVRCLTEIYETVWTELSMIDQIKRRFNEAEHLVHETKKNHARFDFDARFPKMPSYLRRAAIQHALGSVSSYHTRLEQWKNGAISGKPKLVYENHAMPVFLSECHVQTRRRE